MTRLAAVVLLSTLAGAARIGTRPQRPDAAHYTFAQFMQGYSRSYVAASPEYNERAALFAASLAEVNAVNARNKREGRAWTAGVHRFMDWTLDERRSLHGYKPDRMHRPALAVLETNASGHAGRHAHTLLSDSTDTEDEYPVAVRQQGNCGSCWAISAAEAVEAQLHRGGDTSLIVAAQALVDCVPNPQHCGGSGGCDGATGLLAFSYIKDNGIPLEADLPYTAKTQACPSQATMGSGKRVGLSGWKQLPSNQAEPLMRALAEDGPLVVAVDANNWFNYDSGIFDDCPKDAELGHAVLARGYGEEGGNKYWRIQNSWGGDWGEHGFIRIKRHEDESDWCGMDHNPKEGEGCDGGPPAVKVCGTCGVLYDPIMPEGVRVESSSPNFLQRR